MNKVTLDEMMERMGANHRLEAVGWRTGFDPKEQKTVVRPSIREEVQAAVKATGATHLVLFENQDFWSSGFGFKSVVCVGPGCTYGTTEECEGKWLNDLPSQRKYATAWCEVERKVAL